MINLFNTFVDFFKHKKVAQNYNITIIFKSKYLSFIIYFAFCFEIVFYLLTG